jgi:transcriptional regulator with XRE-family HTH domain
MADRIQISRPTLHRLEQGDPAVGLGTYATALWVLGLLDRFEEIASIGNDPVGQRLASEQLPERISAK